MNDKPDARLDVTAFDAVSPSAALELVRPVCASPAWMDAMVARRPHGTLQRAQDVSDSVVAALAWTQVEKALEAHPRIGDRAEAAAAGGVLVAAGAGRRGRRGRRYRAPAGRGHVAYEQKFGQVFLICASGLDAGQLLDALTERLGHDRVEEQIATRRELAAITRLRLARTLA